MESKTESVRNFNHNSLPGVWKTGAVRKSSEDRDRLVSER
jgi:hypothetical protein